MKAVFILIVISALSGCSLFLPDALDSDSLSDDELAGIIFINEYSVSNPYESDWVELYNSNSEGVDLSGFYFSDNGSDYTKWNFPDGTYISGKSFLVIICDGDDNGLHTSFKISGGTEGIYLTIPDGYTVLDGVSQAEDTGTGSYGRVTDGGAAWINFSVPTRGGSNS